MYELVSFFEARCALNLANHLQPSVLFAACESHASLRVTERIFLSQLAIAITPPDQFFNAPCPRQ